MHSKASLTTSIALLKDKSAIQLPHLQMLFFSNQEWHTHFLLLSVIMPEESYYFKSSTQYPLTRGSKKISIGWKDPLQRVAIFFLIIYLIASMSKLHSKPLKDLSNYSMIQILLLHNHYCIVNRERKIPRKRERSWKAAETRFSCIFHQMGKNRVRILHKTPSIDVKLPRILEQQKKVFFCFFFPEKLRKWARGETIKFKRI